MSVVGFSGWISFQKKRDGRKNERKKRNGG
jgi:hypothetical protein